MARPPATRRIRLAAIATRSPPSSSTARIYRPGSATSAGALIPYLGPRTPSSDFGSLELKRHDHHRFEPGCKHAPAWGSGNQSLRESAMSVRSITATRCTRSVVDLDELQVVVRRRALRVVVDLADDDRPDPRAAELSPDRRRSLGRRSASDTGRRCRWASGRTTRRWRPRRTRRGRRTVRQSVPVAVGLINHTSSPWAPFKAKSFGRAGNRFRKRARRIEIALVETMT